MTTTEAAGSPDTVPGPGASDGPQVIGSLSPSRAGDFMTCPLLYRFRVIDRIPERPSPAAVRGTLVHAVLERLYDLPREQRTPPAALDLLAPQWERLRAEEPELARLFAAAGERPAGQDAAGAQDAADGPGGEAGPGGESGQDGAGAGEGDSADTGAAAAVEREWFEQARQMVERYFTLEDPRRLEPAERELFVETVLASGLKLRGYIDRVDVAPSGDVRIVDYKTGTAPRADFEARALFQMKFYALVLWRLQGRVPRLLQLMYLGNGEVLRYEPDEADLRATERKVEALWAAIRRATETGEWRHRTSRLCDWCDHKERCPGWGGTPPPLPEAPVDRPSPADLEVSAHGRGDDL
ncbi:PD-(D/E)XK nuclease family protein [Actinomadura fulvescens]|uniref:RecB family exonuclease n=1 Tax=Actinomadura fulvescens TaxID=46160 RepID=A0ABP6BY92_9ACTN